MKICDLTQFYSPVSGGVKRYLSEKVKYLRSYVPGGQHILVVPGPDNSITENANERIYSIRSPLISKRSRYRVLLNLPAVERILELEKPDLIECGDPYQLAWKAQVSGRALNIPTVGFYHSHFPEAYIRTVMKFFGTTATQITMEMAQRYVRVLYNRFAMTFVPSAMLGEVLKQWGVTNNKTIDLGVDTEVFYPAYSKEPDHTALLENSDRTALRAKLGLTADTKLLLYVGRLAAEKNTQTLFAAFDLLQQNRPTHGDCKFHLLVVGDGLQRKQLQALQKQYPTAVTWRSYCADPKSLAKLYRAADLFVHPGVQETFGLVTLESQACGTPVVGIRGSYMDRIVFKDLLIHWAPENTPASLAAAIVQLVRRPDLFRLGYQTSIGVRKHYSWKCAFDQLFAAYRSVIADHQRLEISV